MAKAWGSGALVVICAHTLWFLMILTEAHSDWLMPAITVMLIVVMNIAGIGAFVTALRAPRHRVPLALSMAPLTAALATLSNWILVLAGTHVDFSGFRGAAGLFAISLAYGIFVSAVGAAIAIWLTKRREATVPAVAQLPPSN